MPATLATTNPAPGKVSTTPDTMPATLATTNPAPGKVFFMIGAQRSGSNWLETLINLSPDISGQQPPHILKYWMPLVSRYGDLDANGGASFMLLQRHILAFVEAAPIPLLNAEGGNLVFGAFAGRVAKCVARSASGKNSVVAILEAVYEAEAEAHGKATWICKSLENSRYHAELLAHFGEDRLRYIYLRRDPRDVCLSCKKQLVVGDDHYFVIAKWWAELQELALRIAEASPELVFQVSYEQLLNNRDFTMWQLFEFAGLSEPKDYDAAKTSGRAKQAAVVSDRWSNLRRGNSIVAEQKTKFGAALEKGEISREDVVIIESVCSGVMKTLGYHRTVKVHDEIRFTPEQIAEYEWLNVEGVAQAKANFAEKYPAEAAARKAQAATLFAAQTETEAAVLVGFATTPRQHPLSEWVVPALASVVQKRDSHSAADLAELTSRRASETLHAPEAGQVAVSA